MLEHFFQRKTRLRQLRRNLFGASFDPLAQLFFERGYTLNTARNYFNIMAKFGVYARLEGIKTPSEVTEELAQRFLREELPLEGGFNGAHNPVDHLLGQLRREGVIPPSDPEVGDPGPFFDLLSRYDLHLRNVRGLAVSTRKVYLRGALLLLTWYETRSKGQLPSALTGPQIQEFIAGQLLEISNRRSKQHLVNNTRSFLRFLRWEGLTETSLDRVVPKVPKWSKDTVPRHLPWEQVRQLIDCVETSTPTGKRDKAILLLLAGLGLRCGEVVKLRLEDIDWRAAMLHIAETKSRRERVLPLPQEIGAALAEYLISGRPRLPIPQVFLRHKAPLGRLQGPGGLTQIVLKYLRQAGITAPIKGAYLLRHSLATHMVNSGVPIKTIADLLGHISIDTTAIYTKVDTTHLALVALPFPGGGL